MKPKEKELQGNHSSVYGVGFCLLLNCSIIIRCSLFHPFRKELPAGTLKNSNNSSQHVLRPTKMEIGSGDVLQLEILMPRLLQWCSSLGTFYANSRNIKSYPGVRNFDSFSIVFVHYARTMVTEKHV